jgi:hypothetical protein
MGSEVALNVCFQATTFHIAVRYVIKDHRSEETTEHINSYSN